MPWLKYRTMWAWGYEEWEWRYIRDGSTDKSFYLEDIISENGQFEHYRRVESEVFDTAPADVVRQKLDYAREQAEYWKSHLETLDGELEKSLANYVYPSGFKVGERVILRDLKGRKFNPHIHLEEGTEAVVLEPPSSDDPGDAVQIRCDNGGFGAIDARCLARK